MEELDVCEYPQQARQKLMKDSVKRIEEWSVAAITSKGIFVLPGRQPPPGERRLYLQIEGPSEAVVRKAKAAMAEAEQKLRNVKKWAQNFDASADPLMKKLDGFKEFLDHDMPDAITFLYRAREILDAYADRNMPADKPAPEAAATAPLSTNEAGGTEVTS